MKTSCIHILVFLILPVLAGCGKSIDPEEERQEVQITPESGITPVGSYFYNEEEYPVCTAVYVETENQIILRISPLAQDKPMTTYAIIGINAELAGEKIDVERAWHNDDYYFIYEDPLKYYSQYHALTSGTILIRKLQTAGHYAVEADVTLPDGTPFRFSYSGAFSPVG